MVRPAVGRPFGIALLSVLIIIGGALDIIAGIVTISLRGDGVLLVALEGTEDEVTALGIGFIVVWCPRHRRGHSPLERQPIRPHPGGDRRPRPPHRHDPEFRGP